VLTAGTSISANVVPPQLLYSRVGVSAHERPTSESGVVHTDLVGTKPVGTPRALAAEEGCYEATRAAALSGVPLSTVYYWAKMGVVVPSISPVREKLWSYADLIGLRIVAWLRHPKTVDHGVIPPSPMKEVRAALAFLDRSEVDLWDPSSSNTGALLVDRTGKVWVRTPDGVVTDHLGRSTLNLQADYLELLAPYSTSGHDGPDLLRPRPRLRIVPLKVAGEPHIAGSRITSRTLAALRRRGFTSKDIADMYGLDQPSVDQALDLERKLVAAAPPAA
jgi:uncharacterized protein (DUF433 family)/DNA-binding transcriptional MerR regulator